ncbi:hypothetical protein ACVDG5_010455 [Mesorhizobium sp. ORM6]
MADGRSDKLSIERIAVARVFTRVEFYELVWSKPLTHLAKEFAISDVALHKICRKHDIPNPPLGWWAKKAAGKKVKQTPLPKAKAGSADTITIANADLSREAAALAGVREQARILASEGDDSQAAPPHPVIERTLAGLRKAKPSDIGIVTANGPGFIKCEVAAASIDRLAVALPRIVRATSLQGFELVAGEGSAKFRSEMETVGFSITESIRREKHVLTDAERAKEEAWERKRTAQRGGTPGTTYSSTGHAFRNGTTIRPASSRWSSSRSMFSGAWRRAGASATPRFSDWRIWPVTSL